ncbi:MAG TPA: PilZ domain-containing protein [Acidimicrobiales bacterium]|nr:PilZ domain-containing protein [Acidimicrobiales bacterium]
MTSLAMMAGPLQVGVRVGVQLSQGGTSLAIVVSCTDRVITLELLGDLPCGTLEEGSIAELLMPRSVGLYKWLCMVSSPPCPPEVEVQLLDGPLFIQRRLDPRVGAKLPVEVRPIRAARRGAPHRALIADLSRGGLKLEGSKPLRNGDTIEVTMELGNVTVAMLGRVVMAYPSPVLSEPGSTDAHVRFLDGQRRGIEAVDRYVAQQLACQWDS